MGYQMRFNIPTRVKLTLRAQPVFHRTQVFTGRGRVRFIGGPFIVLPEWWVRQPPHCLCARAGMLQSSCPHWQSSAALLCSGGRRRLAAAASCCRRRCCRWGTSSAAVARMTTACAMANCTIAWTGLMLDMAAPITLAPNLQFWSGQHPGINAALGSSLVGFNFLPGDYSRCRPYVLPSLGRYRTAIQATSTSGLRVQSSGIGATDTGVLLQVGAGAEGGRPPSPCAAWVEFFQQLPTWPPRPRLHAGSSGGAALAVAAVAVAVQWPWLY